MGGFYTKNVDMGPILTPQKQNKNKTNKQKDGSNL